MRESCSVHRGRSASRSRRRASSATLRTTSGVTTGRSDVILEIVSLWRRTTRRSSQRSESRNEHRFGALRRAPAGLAARRIVAHSRVARRGESRRGSWAARCATAGSGVRPPRVDVAVSRRRRGARRRSRAGGPRPRRLPVEGPARSARLSGRGSPAARHRRDRGRIDRRRSRPARLHRERHRPRASRSGELARPLRRDRGSREAARCAASGRRTWPKIRCGFFARRVFRRRTASLPTPPSLAAARGRRQLFGARPRSGSAPSSPGSSRAPRAAPALGWAARAGILPARSGRLSRSARLPRSGARSPSSTTARRAGLAPATRRRLRLAFIALRPGLRRPRRGDGSPSGAGPGRRRRDVVRSSASWAPRPALADGAEDVALDPRGGRARAGGARPSLTRLGAAGRRRARRLRSRLRGRRSRVPVSGRRRRPLARPAAGPARRRTVARGSAWRRPGRGRESS